MKHLHVPTPGELVSPESGSAIVTVARSLGEAQVARGGEAAYIAREGMAHRPERMGLIEAALPDKVWLSRSEKIFDRSVGAALDRYPASERMWRPIYEAVPSGHSGPVFLHSAPSAVAGLRRHRPSAQGVVYLHNEVTRGWAPTARRRLVNRYPVVCVSRFIAERLLPGAHDRGELLTLTNGVDISHFQPSKIDREPTVLFVGKVSP
jgi:glycosyltransferase involved in cell wall biosynthesis